MGYYDEDGLYYEDDWYDEEGIYSDDEDYYPYCDEYDGYEEDGDDWY
jgi:hypothetical protein